MPFNVGDVFVGVEDGKVNRYDSAGNFLQTLDTTNSGTFTTGMAFDSSGNLYVTNFNADTVVKFDNNGTLLGNFGLGYDASPESILFNAAGEAYVGQADGTRDILKFDAAGTPLTSFNVTVGPRGSDWIQLGPDQCTMYYTSEGNLIRRYDVCNNVQLTDFATLPHVPAFALRQLPDGGFLVADSIEIVRLNAAGTVIQTYDAAGEDNWFALNLDPDGTSFWSADFGTSNVYKFDIATGSVLLTFNTGTTPGATVFGLAIFGEPVFFGCPVANPQTCCQIVLDHITQLVPPLAVNEQGDNKPRQEVTVEADIEGVCPEKVIVCGVVKKKIIYDAVIVNPDTGAVTIAEETKEDELPFQCAIDREDASEGDAFHVVPDGAAVLCTLSEGYQNTGTYNGHQVAWKWHEKDVVKVCIRKGSGSVNS